MGEMPVGTVTFLFTDIEGSTRLWQEDEASMRKAVARHDQLVQGVVAEHGGAVFSTMGDGLAAAFQTTSAALSCAIEAQGLLARGSWETVRPIKVRMGLHTGEAELRQDDYFGTAVNRAARLAAVGHGGQILCSSATAELADESTALIDLGEHRLRDLDRPMHVFQIGNGAFPSLRSLSAFPGNLPTQLTSFVGRQEELAVAARAVEGSRLVTLTGTGGVGKTRLGVQAAATLVTDFPDGVWLCELARAVDRASVLQVVASAIGYLAAPGADLEAGITRFVGARRMLFVLDNCEHLLDPAAALAEMVLERCANVTILATSREPLEARGERVIRVRSLPVPQPGSTLAQLASFDAARLFLDRAQATDGDLTVGAGDAPAIAEICRRLDGIPLAIELAAARVIALAPAEIAAHLDERFRLLTGGRRAPVERHHTLRATIDWSYALMSKRDQTIFKHLGVFPASFDTTAAQAVAAAAGVEAWDVLDGLSSLVAKSMVNADRSAVGPTRYQMLESLRHYAREHLDAGGGSDEARRRHARYYATSAAQISPNLRGPDEAAWRRRLHADLENFRAALTWALDSSLEEDGELAMVILGELGAGMESGWAAATTFADADYEQAVERAQGSTSGHASLVLSAAAINAYYRGDFRRGRELSREAMQGARVSAHPDSILGLNLVFVHPNNLEAELAAALQILEEVGADTWAYAQLHATAAGMAAVVLGNVDLARREATITLETGRRLESQSIRMQGLYALGLASWQSDPIAAQAALEEHIQIARAMDYEPVTARVLALLAQLQARDRGNSPIALQTLGDAIENAHINDDRPGSAVCLARGAAVMAAVEELDTAAVFWGAVVQGVFARLTALPANETPGHDEVMGTIQSKLGNDAYATATARGAAMTYEQINTFALTTIGALVLMD
jgi:predicted ATPase/class 3 adenylate cyclase